MIRINLSSLVNAPVGQREVVVLNHEALVLGDLRLKYLEGELRFTRLANGILVEGVLQSEVQTECTRCLEPFYEPVAIELQDTLGLPGASLTPERPVRVTEDGWADISPLVREYAWLGLPLNPLCTLDCKGLCVHCGGNLNRGECTCDSSEPTDRRWDVLRSLLK